MGSSVLSDFITNLLSTSRSVEKMIIKSINFLINDIYENGSLKNGELMLLDAFGGGLTWGSALVPFAGAQTI